VLIMFGRSRYVEAVSDATRSLGPYAERLRDDEKLRRSALAAVAATLAAWQRVRELPRLRATAAQLVGDPVLRRELAEALDQIREVEERMRPKRRHRVRNLLVLLTGAGAVVVALRMEPARSWIDGVLGRRPAAGGGAVYSPTVPAYAEEEPAHGEADLGPSASTAA
jgi:hypothetical protein